MNLRFCLRVGKPRVLSALLILATVGCVLHTAPRAVAQEGVAGQGQSTLHAVEEWSTFFGEQKVTLHFRAHELRAEPGPPTGATWALALEERVLARGEVPLTPKGGAVEIAVPLTLPPVKTGVILPLTLTVTLLGNDQAALATATKRLWIYPTDAFSSRTAWLKSLNLRLYDPVGRTSRRLDEAGIPYRGVGNADALSEDILEDQPGIAIVGEGLSLEEYRALPAAMFRAAALGRPVLCLAPVAGVIPVPGSDEAEGRLPSALQLRRAEVIAELDKRLDTVWPAGPAATSTLALKAARDQVVTEIQRTEVQRNRDSWSWLQYDYTMAHTQAKSTLVVCGFDIMARWDESPTPRYLFASLLAYLDELRSASEPLASTPVTRRN